MYNTVVSVQYEHFAEKLKQFPNQTKQINLSSHSNPNPEIEVKQFVENKKHFINENEQNIKFIFSFTFIMKISSEIKKLIISAHSDGLNSTEISKRFGINASTVRVIVYLSKKTDKSNRSPGGSKKRLDDNMISTLRSWFEDDCQISLSAAAKKLEETFNVKVSSSTVKSYLDRLHFSFKRISIVPHRRNSPDVIEARKIFSRKLLSIFP